MKRVIVCGGRDFSDSVLMDSVLSQHVGHDDILVHGGARGADNMAGEWARAKGIIVHVYPADWQQHGRSAGPIRNQQMLTQSRPDLVVSFPGGRGTADMVARAHRAGVPVIEVS